MSFITTITMQFNHSENPEGALQLLTDAFATIIKPHMTVEGDIKTHRLTEEVPDKPTS